MWASGASNIDLLLLAKIFFFLISIFPETLKAKYKMSNPGYIYIFSNNEFKQDVYKIGKARNVFKRMNAFTTAYVEPVKIEYISDKCNNYSVVEHEVHLRLKRYRVKTNREFFNVYLDTAIKIIQNVIDELNGIPDDELTNYHDTNYKPNIELFKTKVILPAELDEISISTNSDTIMEFHPVEQFLIHLCQTYPTKTKIELLERDLFQQFQNFLADNNIEFETTPQKLGIRMKNLNTSAITKGTHTSKGRSKIYNLGKLRTLYDLNDEVLDV